MTLTPAHIGLLDRKCTFIHSVLRSSFRKVEIGQEFDTLIAIVDRVPIPSSSHLKSDMSTDYEELTAPKDHRGYHGVAVGIFDSSVAAPDLWSRRDVSLQRNNMNRQQCSTLSFSVTGEKQALRSLQIPLANTIFQNGKPATLYAQRWIEEGMDGDLSCVKETDLQQQTIHMTAGSNMAHGESEICLHTELRPITPPRKVSAAIGNIIRKVELREEHQQPASQELEESINDQIKNGQINREKVEVWALLKSHTSPTQDSISNSKINLQEDIYSGARLLKVLSGGGGWGEKQGLLALDPDYDYDSRASPTYTEANSNPTGRGKMFANIVKPGDTVTFLVNDLALAEHSMSTVNSKAQAFEKRQFTLKDKLMDFGCLPSTMDAMPTQNTGLDSSKLHGLHMLINKYFGILSEHGMSLKVTASFVREDAHTNIP